MGKELLLGKEDIWLRNQSKGGFDRRECLYNLGQFICMRDKFAKISEDDVFDMVSDCTEKIRVPFGMECSCGGRDTEQVFRLPSEMNGALSYNTLFDLASITKLFLSIVYLYYCENRLLSLGNEIGFYSDRYPKIRDIKIKDLLSFNVNLRTSKRIDECLDFEEAYDVLKDVEGSYSESQEYSDMPALILADLLDDIVGMSFSECLLKLLSKGSEFAYDIKWGRDLINDPSCMDYSNEIWKVDKDYCVRNNPRGVVHDSKARILSNNGERLCGHAGIFATISGIGAFCRSLLREELISANTLKMMAEGSGWFYRSSRQSFGYQCYRKYPNPIQTEVPFFLSGYSVAMSGFTGCYLIVDIINGIYVFIGGNRLNRSLSKVAGTMYENIGDVLTYEGNEYYNKINYVYNRDNLRDVLCQIALVKYSV